MRTFVTALFGILLVVCLSGFSACHGEGDRETLHQTREAGAFIEGAPNAPPEVRQAGADVKQNAAVLQNSVGVPADPKPYSPTASADARTKALKEQSEPPGFITAIADFAKPWAPWASTAILAAWGIANRAAKSGALARLRAVYQGVEKVKEKIGSGEALSMETVNETMRTVAAGYNVYESIKTEIAGLKKTGKVSPAVPVVHEAPPATT